MHVFFALVVVLVAVTRAAADEPVAMQLGVAHIGGLYALTDQDFLNEGAAAIRAIGARCIKVALTLDTANPTDRMYPFHSHWPDVATLDTLAGTPYFKALFSKDFDTFILVSFRPDKSPDYWRTEFSQADEEGEEACFAALTRALLESHADDEKTFVIQNWEGDWAVRGSFHPQSAPADAAFDAMTRWLSARQRGVDRGRAEVHGSRSRVLHACEVNLVKRAMAEAAPSVTTRVLPHVSVDLVSYSAWDTRESPKLFGKAIDFIAAHHKKTPVTEGCGVYIGEFGLPETEASPNHVLERCRALVATAQQRACPYAVYWQLYCNEALVRPPVHNEDFKGYWLIRPDGTRSPVCALFRDRR
jgi:hypothetical protein